MSSVTKADKAYWDSIAAIGCIACYKDGIFNPHVSIHHVDGRTKPGAHRKVLALCHPHHQGGDINTPSVHPWKARFEEKYGTQKELMELTNNLLGS